jgi:hypothetical protein
MRALQVADFVVIMDAANTVLPVAAISEQAGGG